MRLLPWLTNPGNPAMSPHAEGKKGTCYTDIIYTVETRKGGWVGTAQKLCPSTEWRDNKHKGSACMWTTEDCCLHRLTNTSSRHALAQEHEHTQKNARECRPLPQVPHKTLLGMKECWMRQMLWNMCITIPQTLKGTQMLSVVNSVKDLTASKNVREKEERKKIKSMQKTGTNHDWWV